MKKLALLFALGLFAFAPAIPAMAGGPGTMKLASPYDVATTLDRFENILKSKGITIFARIDHAAGAKKIGESMAPTQVMLFGNPKLGTPLMKINREAAFDLPLRALAWQDDNGKVWLEVTDPAVLNQRYGLAKAGGVLAKITGALKKLTAGAVAK